MAEGRLQWHPAFSAAFHIELNDELENLHIEEEHMLSKKPLQIDMLIIKKKKYKAYYPELMNLIVRANWELIKEEKEMCEALRELFADELRESEENGLKQGLQNGLELAKNIFKLFRAGISPEEIAEKCGISVEQVKEMVERSQFYGNE